MAIAQRLQIQPSTAREWIRVGHMLRYLPLIDAAFADNDISYAKARILTRWADEQNEAELVDLAKEYSAGRLTRAIAKFLDGDGDDDDGEARDRRHHEDRSLTSYTDGDGMVVIRVVLPPAIAQVILAIINTLVERIARTPADQPDAPAGASVRPSVVGAVTVGESDPPADAPAALPQTLRELRRRWQPEADDDWLFPTVAQQRADAFCALFVGLDNVDLTTEIVIHVRGDGKTFSDGTPISTNAVARQLGDACIRALIHEQRTPIDATNRRRFATTRQKRVVMEAHGHACIDCAATDSLELDHVPPFEETGHTVTTELEPRCTVCHRARHRRAA